MRVLIIPEDPTHDHFVIKPVVEKVFSNLGQRATIEVLRDPHLRGVDEALNAEMVRAIIEDNRMVDLFLIVVDRDCDRLGNVARAAAREAEHAGRVLVCLAEQEVEVWALALHREELTESFRRVREECDPKERYYIPWATRKGWDILLGQGRKQAMRALSGNWNGLKTVCPEIQHLETRIGEFLADR